MARSKFSYQEKVLQSDMLEATCHVGKLNLVFHVPAFHYLWGFCTVLRRANTSNSRRKCFFFSTYYASMHFMCSISLTVV